MPQHIQRGEKGKKQSKGKKQTAIADTTEFLEQIHTYPINLCQINDTWNSDEDEGFTQIIIGRQHPDGKMSIVTFLIDKLCLGVKDVTPFIHVMPAKVRQLLSTIASNLPFLFVDCKPKMAYQYIYAAIDYAAQWGFSPHSDFEKGKYILAPRGTFDEPYHFTFGRNGKPFFVNGPFDNVDEIIQKLEKNAGKGNYDFLIQTAPNEDAEYYMDDDAEFDELEEEVIDPKFRKIIDSTIYNP